LPDGIFSKQKIRFFVHFGGPWNGKGWYSKYSLAVWNMLRPFGTVYGWLFAAFYGHLVI
jgi:hypothetical protein